MEYLTQNWWYLLLVAGFAFIMIKGGGCCGHSHSTENGLGHCGGQTNGSAQNQNYMSGNKNGMMGSSARGRL